MGLVSKDIVSELLTQSKENEEALTFHWGTPEGDSEDFVSGVVVDSDSNWVEVEDEDGVKTYINLGTLTAITT